LSKALYSRLFGFLVSRVNKALGINKQLDSLDVKKEDEETFAVRIQLYYI
jgi:hypothetical protein